jgi:hypothetical protein
MKKWSPYVAVVCIMMLCVYMYSCTNQPAADNQSVETPPTEEIQPKVEAPVEEPSVQPDEELIQPVEQ